MFAQAGLLHPGTVLYHCVHTDEAYLLLRRQSGPTASALGVFGWATAGGQRWSGTF